MSWLLLVLLTACRNPERGLGDLDADNATIAEQPMLAHLSVGLADPDAAVMDLFDEELSFDTGPDPSALLDGAYAEHQALPAGSGQTLSVLTYNTGLLSRRYAVVAKVEVPHLESRLERMGELVFGAGHDIVLLQEVWEVRDAETLAAAGEAAGYRVWFGDKRKFHRETGLLMAVRDELVGGGEVQEQGQYQAQWKSENFPGPNLKRGWMHWAFELAGSGTEIHLFDTHLTPFYTEWQTRNLQVRELGLQVAAVPEDAIVLVGGDFNAGWYYPDDLWVDAEGEEHPGWWRNTAMPALLGYYGGLQDLAVLAGGSEDVPRGDAVPTGADAAWLTTPYGDATLCDGQDTFTATDCNSLYLASYAATEFPVRMDLLWLRDGTGTVRARDRELAFVETFDFSEGTFELSDHYGQAVTLELVE